MERIVDSGQWNFAERSLPSNKRVSLRIDYDASDLRRNVKTLAGKWDSKTNVWKFFWAKGKTIGFKSQHC